MSSESKEKRRSEVAQSVSRSVAKFVVELVAEYGAEHIAGVDEVGRGPLAGEVVAAAVILPPDHGIKGLADSKKLTEKRREQLFEAINEAALAVAIGEASVAEIDQINILQASLLAMHRATDALLKVPAFVLVDGNRLPDWPYAAKAIVGGDALVESISAASIIAKVTRDRRMVELSRQFPEYGFDKHKGYGTAQHLAALREHGPLEFHRRSFAPIKALYAEEVIAPSHC